MSKTDLRASQLITTYGPGAMVDFPDDSVLVGSADHWRFRQIEIVTEPRLQRKIGRIIDKPSVILRRPPAKIENDEHSPGIPVFTFPQWFIVQSVVTSPLGYKARRLVHINDIEGKRLRGEDEKKHSVVPVRFVRACEKGHIGDIDWHAFVHGHASTCCRELFVEERGTTGDLDAIWITCAYRATRVMSQAARRELKALGSCNGSRPWLGPGTREKCGNPNRLLIRSASNAYFPQLLSVISIPDGQDAVDRVVQELWSTVFVAAQTDEMLKVMLQMPMVAQRLAGVPFEKVKAAVARFRDGDTGGDRPVKEVEFEALAEAKEELGADVPDGDFYARTLPSEHWMAPWLSSVARVVLVHRLREVVALIGFTRFESETPDIQGDLDMKVERAPISNTLEWFPALENRGEGVFIQFRPEAIDAWLKQTAVIERDRALQFGFRLWQAEHQASKRQYPGLPYYMLHSLSHLLLISLALECGYPTSSIRERVYAAPGRYGILIYTGSSDAEGTLGGLVDEGRRIKDHLARALELGRLCSNDPVCAFHAPREHDPQPLHGSACHGCLLISETSCEQRNDFLDRALVVPTVENLGAAFFSHP